MPRFSSKAEREQFWRRHLSQQSASGLTTRDYCRKHALQEPSFYSWRRTIRDRDRQPAPVARPTHDAPRPPAFLPVAVVDPPARPHHPPIDVRLANGCRIRVRSGCDRSLLADVLALLQASARTEARPC